MVQSTQWDILYVSNKVYFRHCIDTKAGAYASYIVAEHLAKKGKPFTVAEFVKSCILVTVKELCPERIKHLKMLVFQCIQ
jgi:hypothetical protein